MSDPANANMSSDFCDLHALVKTKGLPGFIYRQGYLVLEKRGLMDSFELYQDLDETELLMLETLCSRLYQSMAMPIKEGETTNVNPHIRKSLIAYSSLLSTAEGDPEMGFEMIVRRMFNVQRMTVAYTLQTLGKAKIIKEKFSVNTDVHDDIFEVTDEEVKQRFHKHPLFPNSMQQEIKKDKPET